MLRMAKMIAFITFVTVVLALQLPTLELSLNLELFRTFV